MGALLVTATGALVPLSEQLVGLKVPGAWSTVLVAAAGLFVSIDRLGDFTSGWVRYMNAQQKVERLRVAFELDWSALKVKQATTERMLERATAFVVEVSKVVENETQEWATEFQNALKETERERKAAAEAERTGALEISVTNHESVPEWTLEVDGNARGRTTGKRLAVTDVLAGMRRIKAYGRDANGKTWSDEKAIKIEGGTAVARELELA